MNSALYTATTSKRTMLQLRSHGALCHKLQTIRRTIHRLYGWRRDTPRPPKQLKLRDERNPDYMNDEDPEMDQIPSPNIWPQINLARIGAQMNALTNEEYNELIQMMGETHPHDFLEAWSDRHWSSEGRHQTYTCLAGNQWTCDSTSTRSRKEPKHLPS